MATAGEGRGRPLGGAANAVLQRRPPLLSLGRQTVVAAMSGLARTCCRSKTHTVCFKTQALFSEAQAARAIESHASADIGSHEHSDT